MPVRVWPRAPQNEKKMEVLLGLLGIFVFMVGIPMLHSIFFEKRPESQEELEEELAKEPLPIDSRIAESWWEKEQKEKKKKRKRKKR